MGKHLQDTQSGCGKIEVWVGQVKQGLPPSRGSCRVSFPLRRAFVLDIMRQLVAHLRQQRGPEAAAQLPTRAPDPVLQVLAFLFA